MTPSRSSRPSSVLPASRLVRPVVLSSVGIERSPEYGYYVGKVAQERAYRESSPGVIVVRATQFYEFAAQMIEWSAVEGVAAVHGCRDTSPIDGDEVVDALLQAASGADPDELQIAGPAREQLLELSRTWAAAHAPGVKVVAGEAPESMAGGAMLPQDGDGFVLRGHDWRAWFAAQGRRRHLNVRPRADAEGPAPCGVSRAGRPRPRTLRATPRGTPRRTSPAR